VGRCTLCATCERACPGQAITLDKQAKVAKVDDSLCIRCYCCHELCPQAAIDLDFTGLGRVVNLLGLVR
jgi:Fe-S-cluster-containing hydrogenase component 2